MPSTHCIRPVMRIELIRAGAACSGMSAAKSVQKMQLTLSCSRDNLRQIGSGMKSDRAPMNWPTCTSQISTDRPLTASEALQSMQA